LSVDRVSDRQVSDGRQLVETPTPAASFSRLPRFAPYAASCFSATTLPSLLLSGRMLIQSTLNDVLRSEELDGEARERISLVLHQVSRLKHITHCLLLLSQADAGELPVGRERYDLSADLKGLMDDAESLCETAGLAFEKHIEPGVCVEVDRALMHQVFQNLVSNAVKYSLPNGSVRVRSEPRCPWRLFPDPEHQHGNPCGSDPLDQAALRSAQFDETTGQQKARAG
jgi:hypothetical protein